MSREERRGYNTHTMHGVHAPATPEAVNLYGGLTKEGERVVRVVLGNRVTITRVEALSGIFGLDVRFSLPGLIHYKSVVGLPRVVE